MTEPTERTTQVEVPPSTGVDGFLHVIRGILKLPRVQRITIDKSGSVMYTHVASEDVEKSVDFTDVMPYYVIRNAPVKELVTPGNVSPAAMLVSLLDLVSNAGLSPLSFVVGKGSCLWSWLLAGDDVEVSSRTELLGHPVLEDQHIPPSVLVLCAGPPGDRALSRTTLSLKLEMRTTTADADVEIL